MDLAGVARSVCHHGHTEQNCWRGREVSHEMYVGIGKISRFVLEQPFENNACH